MNTIEQIVGAVEHQFRILEGEVKLLGDEVKLTALIMGILGTPSQDADFLIYERTPVDRLLQIALGIRIVVESYDPEFANSQSILTQHPTGLSLGQIFLRNTANALGKIYWDKAIGDYNVNTLSPVESTLANVNLEARKKFKVDLIKAVDAAYSALQAYQLRL